MDKDYCMTAYERELAGQGYTLIGGADEVGRGPLAGPVVACVAVLPVGYYHADINDSKKVSPKKRILLADIIKENAVSYAVSEIGVGIIDEINILEAARRAMTEAFFALSVKPDFLLTDAMELPGVNVPQKAVTGGDAKSISIAAASIIAKVYRDALMVKLHEQYPVYRFDKNKGYGTRAHIAALREHGPCPAHRKLFIRNFV